MRFPSKSALNDVKWRQYDVIMTSKSNISNFILHIMIPHKISLKIGQVIFIHSANFSFFIENIYIFCVKMVKMTQKDVILTSKSTKMTSKSTFRKKNLTFLDSSQNSLKDRLGYFCFWCEKIFFHEKMWIFGRFPPISLTNCLYNA